MTDGAGAGAESGDDDDEHAERFETCSDEFTLSWQVQDSGWIEISEVLKSDDRAAGARQRVTDVLSDIFRAAEIGRTVEATIVFADDALVRDLNTSFRGKSTATNVLSFPAPADALNPDAAGISQPRYAGDVIIARQTVVAEAGDLGIPVDQHLTHLVVHGALHLAGYDHDDPAQAEIMEDTERKLLSELGFPDPYERAKHLADRAISGSEVQ